MAEIDTSLCVAASRARGLRPEDSATVRELVRVWERTRGRNELRERYYLSHVPIRDLGIAIPPEVARRLRTRVDWPRKAVLALANRSTFDGFTSDDAETEAELGRISAANDLRALYRRNVVGELKHCCSFWTVTDAGGGSPVVSAYPATAAAAVWDDSLKAIRAGIVVAESRPVPGGSARLPSVLLAFTATDVITLRRDPSTRLLWSASYQPHSMGRPLMEAMPWEPTLERPFGHSRITRTVMSITDDAIRQRARMEVAAESSALPQMWLLGTAARMINDGNRYDASIGALNEVTKDEDGDHPSVWQSTQLQMAPHIDYLRTLAQQFSSATNVPLSELGVTTDNPSSAEAIYAAKEALVIDAQNLNAQNGIALRNVALMALAVSRGGSFAEQRDSGVTVSVRWPDPAYPSVVAMADAMLKVAQTIPTAAGSEVVLERLGFNGDEILRLQRDMRAAQARQGILSTLAGRAGADAGDGS